MQPLDFSAELRRKWGAQHLNLLDICIHQSNNTAIAFASVCYCVIICDPAICCIRSQKSQVNQLPFDLTRETTHISAMSDHSRTPVQRGHPHGGHSGRGGRSQRTSGTDSPATPVGSSAPSSGHRGGGGRGHATPEWRESGRKPRGGRGRGGGTPGSHKRPVFAAHLTKEEMLDGIRVSCRCSHESRATFCGNIHALHMDVGAGRPVTGRVHAY
jgi:hypothetical protein